MGMTLPATTFSWRAARAVLTLLAACSAGTAAAEPAAAPDFVDVPGGSFTMGCAAGDEFCADDERPAHAVKVQSFRLAKQEVTVAQFRRFVAATGYRTDAERGTSGPSGCWSAGPAGTRPKDWPSVPGRSWSNPGFAQRDDEPVVCISWNDAVAYAAWLGAATGRRIRLPSEAEWEYAARAGSSTVRPWGDAPEGACAYANAHDLTLMRTHGPEWEHDHHACEDGYVHTAPVGSLAPNAFGLNDMLGNVWEWTADCYAPYEAQGGKPPSAAAPRAGACTTRVFRGGSWFNSPQFVRSSERYPNDPGEAAFSVGFRLAEDAR